MRAIFLAVLALFLFGCVTDGQKDSGGVSMGAGGCEPADPSETKIDWRSFGAAPSSVTICKYGNRNMETIKFSSPNDLATIKREVMYHGYIDESNKSSIVTLIQAIKNTTRHPRVSDIKSGNGIISTFNYGEFSSGNNNCIYFMFYPNADTKLAGGGGWGTAEPIHGYYCYKTNKEAALKKIRQLRFSTASIPLDNNAAKDTPNARRAARTESLPLAISWEGYRELMIGKLLFVETSSGAKMSLTLPKNDGTCQGIYQIAGGSFGTSYLPHGSWAMSCTNGRLASGRYASTGPNRGNGEGTDDLGNKIRVTIGAEN